MVENWNCYRRESCIVSVRVILVKPASNSLHGPAHIVSVECKLLVRTPLTAPCEDALACTFGRISENQARGRRHRNRPSGPTDNFRTRVFFAADIGHDQRVAAGWNCQKQRLVNLVTQYDHVAISDIGNFVLIERRLGQTKQGEPEPVAALVRHAGHQAQIRQRAQVARHSRLGHVQIGRDISDALRSATVRQEFQQFHSHNDTVHRGGIGFFAVGRGHAALFEFLWRGR